MPPQQFVATPLQFGVPGAPELVVLLLIVAILLVIPLAVGYWIAGDAMERGSDHHVAWGLMTFVSGLASLVGLLVFVVFYLVVREDVGTLPGE